MTGLGPVPSVPVSTPVETKVEAERHSGFFDHAVCRPRQTSKLCLEPEGHRRPTHDLLDDEVSKSMPYAHRKIRTPIIWRFNPWSYMLNFSIPLALILKSEGWDSFCNLSSPLRNHSELRLQTSPNLQKPQFKWTGSTSLKTSDFKQGSQLCCLGRFGGEKRGHY
jgi:hypothetical protein